LKKPFRKRVAQGVGLPKYCKKKKEGEEEEDKKNMSLT
jgi:hypothetical protein